MHRAAVFILMVLVGALPLHTVAQETDAISPDTAPVIEVAEVSAEQVAVETVTEPTRELPEMAGDFVPGEVIVKYKESRIDLEDHADQQAADAAIKSLSMETVDVIEGMNMAVVETAEDTTVAEAIAELESNPAVEYAEPNYVRSIEALASTSVELANSWALQNTGQTVQGVTGTLGADIDALSAWDIASGTAVTVAVIDTGVDYTHPELTNNMWDGSTCVSETGTTSWSCTHGYDFEYDTSDPRATTTGTAQTKYRESHGTHVAGVIAAAHDDVGVVGIAYGAKIMALRFGLDTASEIRAIDFAIQNNIKIINASFGGDTFSQAEYDAVERFQNAGGLFVASAGNSGEDLDAVAEPAYPASYDLPGIVSVAATDAFDTLASYSNFGATTVDLAAPGSNIRSTIPLGGYSYKSGTSMATPLVAGVAALLWSHDPTLTAAEVKAALMDSGDELATLSGKTVSGKRLNAYTALASVATVPPVADTEAPVITLLGDNPMNLTIGNTFTDPGAEVTDNVDATTTVMGVGTVDSATAGSYTLTYSATDTAGNVATTSTRSVVVSAPVVSGGGGGGGSSSSTSRRGGGGGGSTITRATTPVSVARPLTSTVATPRVLGATTFTFTQDLTVGSTGNDVTELQRTLTTLGFYSGPVTGYFGPLTASAVSAFQNARGLTSAGRVGPQTRALLNQGQTGTPVATVSPTPSMADMQAKLVSLLAQLAALQAMQ